MDQLPDNNQVNVLMGISNLQGLTSNDLPIDQLKPFNVHLHDKAYSPNNAHLEYANWQAVCHCNIMGSFNQKMLVYCKSLLIINKHKIHTKIFKICL